MTRTRRPFVRAALFSLAMSFPAILAAPAQRAIVAGDTTHASAWHRPGQVHHEGGADRASLGPVLPQEANGEPCLHDEVARQLDFWVGAWDVYNPQGEQVGVNEVQRLLKGCLLLENWTGAGGSSGKSMNYFDPLRQTWRQVWVSDQGNVLDYRHGVFRGDRMVFTGLRLDPAGDTVQDRLTFVHVSRDTVRQVFEASGDGGETWDTTWVGIYVRQAAGEAGRASDDAGSGGLDGVR